MSFKYIWDYQRWYSLRQKVVPSDWSHGNWTGELGKGNERGWCAPLQSIVVYKHGWEDKYTREWL